MCVECQASQLNMEQILLIVLTLLRPMDFFIKFDTVKSGWSIVYIEGFQAIIYLKKIFV